MAMQQSVMSGMMSKLTKLDRASAPPLLPSPPLLVGPPPTQDSHTSPPPPIASLTMTRPSSPTRLPKLEVPLFTGEHVLSWLFQIEHFFTYHHIPPDQKIDIAAFYMTGKAIQWYHWLSSTHQIITWEHFSRHAELRFGPSTFINHKAQLFKLKQSSTVTAYLDEFKCLSTLVQGLSLTSLLNCFLSGLRDDIQRELYILKPTSLHDAMGMAQLLEDKCNVARLSVPPSRFGSFRPPPHLPAPTTLAPPNRSPPAASGVMPIKKLTPAQMAVRREQGLCFNCDSKFTRGHRCTPPQFLCLLADEDDDPSPDPAEPELYLPDPEPDPPPREAIVNDTPCISYHALNGFTVPSTLKLAGQIHGKDVVVFIDGGSTNNFIQSRWATHLGLPIQCGGESLHVPLQLGTLCFRLISSCCQSLVLM